MRMEVEIGEPMTGFIQDGTATVPSFSLDF